MKAFSDKSNRMEARAGLRALAGRLAGRLAGLAARAHGQGTVEYMLIIVILVAPMAMALAVLFDAFDVLYARLGYIIGRPYP